MAVISPDGAEWVGVSGVSDLDNNTNMVPDLKFNIGSVTKTFTATVILQLVKEGNLSLDQKLGSILPGIVPNADNITIRMLLNHTSGIFEYVDSPITNFLQTFISNPYKHLTPESLIAIANANSPYFLPGEGWHYSNTNYILLGMIIEKITGNTYAHEVASRIIAPLNLNNTLVPETLDIPAGSSHLYLWDASNKKWTDVTVFDSSYAGAAGAMISNTDDLLVWLDALLKGTLLNTQLTEEMFTCVEASGVPPITQYGLGVMKIGSAVGHTGDGARGQTAVLALHGWKFVILTNASITPVGISALKNIMDNVMEMIEAKS